MTPLELINDHLSLNDMSGNVVKEGDALSEGAPYITVDKIPDGTVVERYAEDGRIDVEVKGAAIEVWRYKREENEDSGTWKGPIKINLSKPDSLDDLVRAIEYLKTNPLRVENDLFWDRTAAP